MTWSKAQIKFGIEHYKVFFSYDWFWCVQNLDITTLIDLFLDRFEWTIFKLSIIFKPYGTNLKYWFPVQY